MSQPRITLDQWRALVGVVDTGSYAKAADTLHKSQSSVTYSVQQIESQLGVEAFRIEGRKAVLTPTGDLLYRRARFLLDEAAALEQSATRLSAGWEAEVRLAAEVLLPPWLLLKCLAKLSEESPHTRVEVTESVLGHRTEALSQRLVDLAVFSSLPAGFVGEPLMRMRFRLYAHPDHPLHRVGRPLTLRDLRAHRHLLVRESSPERTSERSFETAQRWTVSQYSTSIEAARSGYGFAWLPDERIRDDVAAGTLKALAMREGGERFADLYLIFSDPEHAGPATRRLAEILRETVAQECERAAAAVAPENTPAAGQGRRRPAPARGVKAKRASPRT